MENPWSSESSLNTDESLLNNDAEFSDSPPSVDEPQIEEEDLDSPPSVLYSQIEEEDLDSSSSVDEEPQVEVEDSDIKEAIRRSLEDDNEKTKDVFLHPEIEPWIPPENFLNPGVELHNHQKTGVQWMIDRERSDAKHVRGGILMDEPGLGKTLTTLCLIKASPLDKQRPTLIICPANLIRVWEDEIRDKFPKNTFNFCSYYTNKRHLIKNEDYMKTDIILTSYSIMIREWDKKQRDFTAESIFREMFGRIILDEAHHIRNKETLTSRTITQLIAERYWCITATPVYNQIDDFFPLFSFMCIDPFQNNYSMWVHEIVRPMINTQLGKKNLNKYLMPITLRRTKAILDLPTLYIHNEVIDLTELENDFYQSLFYFSRERVRKIFQFMNKLKMERTFQDPEEYKGDKSLTVANSSLLSLILRLRQACVCPSMVLRGMKRLQTPINSKCQTDPEYKLSLLSSTEEVKRGAIILKQYTEGKYAGDECSICMNEIASHAAIPCNHICCESCWDILFKTTNRCPHCRRSVYSYTPLEKRVKELEHYEDARKQLEDEIEECNKSTMEIKKTVEQILPSKIDWVLTHIKTIAYNEKVLIVSQWTKILDIFEIYLKEYLPTVRYCRLDGKVAPMRRMEIVEHFQTTPETRICLVSLSSSAEGITMTAATRVYHLDPWWNAPKDYQMSNRAHRIGQTKDVHIHHIYAKNTIEDNMQSMRTQKKQISDVATGEFQKDEHMPFANKVKLLFNLQDEDQKIKKSKPDLSYPTFE